MPVYPSLTEIGMTIARVIVFLALGLGCGWLFMAGVYRILHWWDSE